MWTSSDPTVATVGFYTGIVEAVGAGEVTITATTVDGSYTDSVAIKVYIDTVTVSKDGYFNKVVFHSTGKVWKCVNNDLLYDDNNITNIELADRSNDNCFVYYDRSDPENANLNLKTYTDEELKLLYAIDPYGVAHYVYLYAMKEFDTLGEKIAEKDRVFRVLFNREPKYFMRTLNGNWIVTTDKSNPQAILSESETLFGMHNLIDEYTKTQLIQIGTTVLSLVVPSVVGKVLSVFKTSETIIKVCSFVLTSALDSILSATVDLNFENKFNNTPIFWAYKMVSIYSSLFEIVETATNIPSYYPEIFNYYINNINYDINMELQNGETYRLREIKEAITIE